MGAAPTWVVESTTPVCVNFSSAPSPLLSTATQMDSPSNSTALAVVRESPTGIVKAYRLGGLADAGPIPSTRAAIARLAATTLCPGLPRRSIMAPYRCTSGTDADRLDPAEMAARRPAPEVCGVTVYDDLQPRRLGGQDHRHSRLVTGIRSFHVPAALAARRLGAGGKDKVTAAIVGVGK